MTMRVTCNVNEDDKAMDDMGQMPEGLTGSYMRAIDTTDSILNSLEYRSRVWDDMDFADNVTLTRGATFGVMSDPFVHFFGLGFTYEISCTVKSLQFSRKCQEQRLEDESAAKMDEKVDYDENDVTEPHEKKAVEPEGQKIIDEELGDHNADSTV